MLLVFALTRELVDARLKVLNLPKKLSDIRGRALVTHGSNLNLISSDTSQTKE